MSSRKDQAPHPETLSDLLHRKGLDSIPVGDDRTRAFRAALGLPGAKHWTKALLSPALQTYVNNTLFRTWLKLYCRIPIRNQGQAICPRPKFKKPPDPCGNHLLICAESSLVGSANVTNGHTTVSVCKLRSGS